MYYGTMRDIDVENATSLGKIKAGDDINVNFSDLHFTLQQKYRLIVTVSGSWYKIELSGVGSLGMSDSDFLDPGGVKFGVWQAKGW
ncbi:unnamed protein product, partial [marine sediment metagenome]